MFAWPTARSRQIAKPRRVALFSGPWSVRTFEAPRRRWCGRRSGAGSRWSTASTLAAGEAGQHVDRLACAFAGQDLHHPGPQPPVAMGPVVELRRRDQSP
jgi:hypothetical protein